VVADIFKGFLTCASLIVAIGAQNDFVVQRSLRRNSPRRFGKVAPRSVLRVAVLGDQLGICPSSRVVRRCSKTEDDIAWGSRGRRVLARRPVTCIQEINKRCSPIGLPPKYPHEPPISCSYAILQSSCALSSILIDSLTNLFSTSHARATNQWRACKTTLTGRVFGGE
jgi:hypothetical protein